MSRNGKPKFGLYDNLDIITANRIDELVRNLTTERMSQLRNPSGIMDPRRNFNADCGYPETGSITADGLKEIYLRDPLAARVVELMAKECWEESPAIFETDDQDRETEFEKAWDELEVSLSGGVSWHQTEKGSAIWEYLFRADVLSGIGAFGVLLMGFDDGRNLQDPVAGAVIEADNPQPYANQRYAPAMPDGWLTETEDAALLNPGAAKIWNGRRDPKTGAATYETKNIPKPGKVHEHIIANWRAERELMEARANAEHISGETLLVNLANGSAQFAPVVNAPNKFDGPAQYDLQLGQPKPLAEGALAGTDQQYFAPIQGPSEMPAPTPSKKKLKLLFLRAFDESLVQIVRYEWNIRNPRFGLPVMYRITLNDPRESHSGVGLPLATVYVHWSRVIHLADVNHQAGSSEIFAAPRLRPVLNEVLDAMKICGSGAEGYYQSCFEKLSFETIPQLGGDVDVDEDSMRDLFENIQNSLQRAWYLRGMQAKTIAPSVVDPTPHYAVHVERICIKMACPVPVFKGYEIGEQASENNDETWDGRVRQRQYNYLIPRAIVPFVDRLITVGVLPEPQGYTCEWPAPDNLSDKDKAGIALQKTQAIAAYVGGNCESVVPPQDYFTEFLGMEDEKVMAMLESAAKATEADMHTMPAPGEQGHPATPPEPPKPPPAVPIKVKGADGAETLVHPDSVEPPGEPKEPAGNGATENANPEGYNQYKHADTPSVESGHAAYAHAMSNFKDMSYADIRDHMEKGLGKLTVGDLKDVMKRADIVPTGRNKKELQEQFVRRMSELKEAAAFRTPISTNEFTVNDLAEMDRIYGGDETNADALANALESLLAGG